MPKPTNFVTPEMQLSRMQRQFTSHSVMNVMTRTLGLQSLTQTDVLLTDMSYWQGTDIDWDLLCAEVDGFIFRGMYGIWKDTLFDWYYEEATKRGKPVGAYHYIIGNYSPLEQAQMFKNAIEGKELKLGIHPDIEDTRSGTALTRQVVDSYVENVAILIGVPKTIYTGKYAWQTIMGNTSYIDFDLWVANYGVSSPALPYNWNEWKMWQYTSSGYLSGFADRLDLNYFAGTKQDFANWIGEVYQPPVAEETIYQVEVICAGLYIRSGASTQYPVLYTVLKGTILDVYEEVGLWLRVGQGKFCSGNSAYVKRIEMSDKEKLDTLWAWYEESHL